MSNFNSKVVSATKWSAVTEIMAKLVQPISTMILARLLTPDAYGVMASLAMVISFTEIFSEAGFGSYIIQHEFKNAEEKDQASTVAFYTNFVLGLFFWLIIVFIRNPLAGWLGNPNLGMAIAVSCISIPLQAMTVVQKAIFQREFDFKTLFYVRLISILVPFFVTIPLAYFFKNYWALVGGTVAVNLSNAITLFVKSKWKPDYRYYSVNKLKEMLSFTGWVLIDALLIWCTNYIDIFLIARNLSSYYLGLYNTSITVVAQITALITSAVVPILLPAFSRLQDDTSQLQVMILKFEKYLSIVLIPIGAGILLYSDLLVTIMLGKGWIEASGFIGLWGLTGALTIVFCRMGSNLLPAIGKPRLSVVAQLLQLVVVVPTVIISLPYGFHTLYVARAIVRLEGIIVYVILIRILINLPIRKMVMAVVPEVFSTLIMSMVAIMLLKISSSIVWQLISISICVVTYFLVLFAFKEERDVMRNVFVNKILKNRISYK